MCPKLLDCNTSVSEDTGVQSTCISNSAYGNLTLVATSMGRMRKDPAYISVAMLGVQLYFGNLYELY